MDSSYCVDRAQQGVTKWGGILIFNDTLLLLALFHIENLLLAVVCCRYNLSINTYTTSHESLSNETLPDLSEPEEPYSPHPLADPCEILTGLARLILY